MKLNDIQIQQFGKLKEKKIFLEDGINVIYGPNESGKSTLHGFIRSMFFGIPRYRGRASKTDPYTRYEPWDRPVDFAGNLGFSVGEKDFRIWRNFYKKDERAQLVCETDGEQLSIEQGDLQMLLGDISESVYDNTVSVSQLRSETDEGMVRELQNHMTNYEGAGAADVDVERAVQRLKKKKKEWEGKRKQLENAQRQRREQQENQIEYLREEQRKLDEQQNRICEEYTRMEDEYRRLSSENFQQSKEKQREEGEIREPVKKKGKMLQKGILLAVSILLAAAGLVSGNVFLGAFMTLTALALAGIGIVLISRAEENRREQTEHKREENHIPALRERLKELEQRMAHMQGQQETLASQREEKRVMLDNLLENLMEMQEISPEVKACDVELESLALALTTLESLSSSMRKRIGCRLQNRMEEILGEMTEGKYNRIFLDDQMKIHLFAWDRQVSLYQLSRGTVEQVYFALRMAVSEVLCEEPLPILLDDVFAMYDEKRLEQTLSWLERRGGQILIFTCHRREIELLEKLGIKSNIVKLEEQIC
ncbi:MAG: AAA family ATPase [Bacillota bacterium]|nr:AAA family ATPase [Bacillota bacterium]